MTMNVSGAIPPPRAPMVGADGQVTVAWRTWFQLLSVRTGGVPGVVSTNVSPATALPLVDSVGAVGTSLLYARQDHAHPNAGKIGSSTLMWSGGNPVQNGTFIFAPDVPYGLTINSVAANVGGSGGSFVANIQIVHAGTPTSITGLSAVSVSGTSTTLATGANVMLAGDALRVVITSVSGAPLDAYLTLNFTRN